MTPVWLHGWPLDERMWEREVARFAGVAARLYGRGDSIDGWSEQLLAELDGDDLALVGSWHEWSRHDDLPIEGGA